MFKDVVRCFCIQISSRAQSIKSHPYEKKHLTPSYPPQPTYVGLSVCLSVCPHNGPLHRSRRLLTIVERSIHPPYQVQQHSSVKSPRDGGKVLDVEWASSDKPILASIDGCIRITDIPMKIACGPFEDSALSTPVFAPHLLSARWFGEKGSWRGGEGCWCAVTEFLIPSVNQIVFCTVLFS